MAISSTVTLARTRLGALALAAAGALFILYPALRPWHDEATTAGAITSMSSSAWIASHLFAMLGFILVALGLLALWGATAGTRAEPTALAAVLTSWLGAGLTLPYYGAETFGLPALASRAAAGESFDLLAAVDAVRFQPVAVTTFGLGLLLLALAGVLTGIAVWRAGRLARASGLLFAAGYALFLPQFFAPAPVRIGHGILLGIGLGWLALALWRAVPATAPEEGPPLRATT